MAEPAPARPVVNPYPGLRPFRSDEKHLFFGREQQVDRMVEKLAARRFLAVVGGSGSGKSSLVNCGLRPALHRGNMASAGAAWRMAQMRPGSDPVGALARALAEPGVLFGAALTGALSSEALVESTLRLGSLGLVDIVEQADLPANTQLLVVADQFEELFRFQSLGDGAAAEDAVAFVRLLLEAAAQSAVPIHVVLTMRSDFLGDCARYEGLPEAINEGQYLVPRLTRNEIRSAISGPAAVAGATLSPVLVTRLLNDVGDNPDQLSILQHALNRSWYHWETDGRGRGEIEPQHYDAAGGMANALNLHADKAFAELGDEASRQLCERVFSALTDTGTDARGIRRPTRLQALAAMTGAEPARLVAVIDVFRKPSRSFLMPPLGEALGPNSVVDISHESLMRLWSRLKQWANEEARSARIYRRLRETALEHAAGKASLWRDPDLQVALDWRERVRPTPTWAALYGGDFDIAMGFLDQSRELQAAANREAEIERRWQAGWNFVPLAMVLIPFIYFQPALARAIHGGLQGTVLEGMSDLMSHLLAGTPVAVGYMLLEPFLKRRFRLRQLAALTAAQPALPVAATSAAPALDIDRLGHASAGRRACAQGIDWLITGIPLFYMLGADDLLRGIAALFGIPALWLYHVPGWRSGRQGTLGMRMVGIVLVDREGRRIGWMRATGRFFARFLSYYTLGVGFLMVFAGDKHQTLHDRMAGTLVLRRPPKAQRTV